MITFDEVLEALESCGLIVDCPKLDGQLHRVPTLAKPKSKNGWYVCFEDVLIVGDWTTSVTQTFTSGRKKKASKRDWQRIKKLVEKSQKEMEQRQHDAALVANNIYASSSSRFKHFPYLHRKKVNPTRDMRIYWNEQRLDKELIIPLVDLNTGEICNIQRITHNGGKFFVKGARVKGLCFPIGLNYQPSKLIVCEGVATGLSLFEHTNTPVLASLNAGNLKAVATQARLSWPDVELIIAADDDYLTELKIGVNTGLVKAKEAANASLATVSIPPFSKEQKLAGLTDWNDHLNCSRKRERAA